VLKKKESGRSFSSRVAQKAKLEGKQPCQPVEVKINIGVVIRKDGKLSIKRGATLPLTVSPSIGSQELLIQAV
jgi:hypothetical protein